MSANPEIEITDLPNEIQSLVTLAQSNGTFDKTKIISLAELNDKIHLTFNQIADVIEKCL